MSFNYRVISLRFQVQAILVRRLLAHLTVQNTWLDEFTTRAKLLHGLRLVELSSELGDKNKQQFRNLGQSLSNSRLMTNFWISLVPSPIVQSLLSR